MDSSQQPKQIFISTTNEVPGYEVIEYRGVAFGITIRTRGVGGQCTAGCEMCVGGEITSFTKMAIEARNDAQQRLVNDVAARGANAVIGVKFDSSSGGAKQSMSEIVAYGTAVIVVPKK